jgi:hypothetical protein
MVHHYRCVEIRKEMEVSDVWGQWSITAQNVSEKYKEAGAREHMRVVAHSGKFWRLNCVRII